MAINKQPQNSGSDAVNKPPDPKTNGKKPKQLDLTSNLDRDLQENLLMSVTPQASSSIGSVDRQIETEVWRSKTPWWKMWQLWEFY